MSLAQDTPGGGSRRCVQRWHTNTCRLCMHGLCPAAGSPISTGRDGQGGPLGKAAIRAAGCRQPQAAAGCTWRGGEGGGREAGGPTEANAAVPHFAWLNQQTRCPPKHIAACCKWGAGWGIHSGSRGWGPRLFPAALATCCHKDKGTCCKGKATKSGKSRSVNLHDG